LASFFFGWRGGLETDKGVIRIVCWSSSRRRLLTPASAAEQAPRSRESVPHLATLGVFFCAERLCCAGMRGSFAACFENPDGLFAVLALASLPYRAEADEVPMTSRIGVQTFADSVRYTPDPGGRFSGLHRAGGVARGV